MLIINHHFVNNKVLGSNSIYIFVGPHLWIWEVQVQDCYPNANLNVLEEIKINWKVMEMHHIFSFHQMKKNLTIFAPQVKHQPVHQNKYYLLNDNIQDGIQQHKISITKE